MTDESRAGSRIILDYCPDGSSRCPCLVVEPEIRGVTCLIRADVPSGIILAAPVHRSILLPIAPHVLSPAVSMILSTPQLVPIVQIPS
jgi:hypothetical protein